MALETRQIEGSNPTTNNASLQVMALKMTKTMAITIGEIIGKCMKRKNNGLSRVISYPPRPRPVGPGEVQSARYLSMLATQFFFDTFLFFVASFFKHCFMIHY